MSNQQNIDLFFQQFAHRMQTVQQKLPTVIGTEVVNSALDNFKSESYFGEKWQPRKDRKNKRKLLVRTGQLLRSPRIVRSSPGMVVVGSDVPYSAIHNNGGATNRAARSETFVRNRYKTGAKGRMFGGMGAFKKGTTAGRGQTYKSYVINMPRRQFLGAHPHLQKRLKNIIKQEVLDTFK